MTCQQRRDLYLLDLAGALDADESAELRQHLATGCVECAGYAAEAEATLAQLSLAAGAQSPPPHVRQELLNRIQQTPSFAAPLKIPPEPRRSGLEAIILSSAIAAVIAVAISLFVAHMVMTSRMQAQVAQMEKLKTQITQLTELLAIERTQPRTTSSPSMEIATMSGPAQPTALGRTFVDTKNGKWYFFASGLNPLPPGKTYELWLISDGKKMPAGTFDVHNGTGMLLGAVPPLPDNAPVTLAVTDEPQGGVAIPTGKPQIIGKLEKEPL